MQLEAVGVTQPVKHGPFQSRLKFGKQAYCVSAWLIKHKLMQVMAESESGRRLLGLVQLDDAYWGGRRRGGSVVVARAARRRSSWPFRPISVGGRAGHD